MIAKPALLLAFAIMLPGTAAASCDSIESLHWMLGAWVSTNEKTATTETWIHVSNRTLEGHGTTESLTTKKVQSSESLLLAEMSGELFYLAKVTSNEMPVPFKLVACKQNSAVFENASHDFPKSLSYHRTDARHLQVLVRGESEMGFEIEYVLQDDH